MILPGSQLRAMLRPNVAWLGLLATLALTGIGIAAISVSSQSEVAADQGIWLVISLCAMLVAMAVHPKIVSLAGGPLLAIGIGLLVLLLVPGIPRSIVLPQNGARCWINLHFMNFQPSEIVKILFVMALARHMRFRANYLTLRALLVPFGITFIPVMLIHMQPDSGTAMLFVPALFVVLLAGGAKMKHVWILAGLALAAVALNVAVIAYDPPPTGTQPSAQRRLPRFLHLLRPYQEKRSASMIWRDDDGQYEGRQQDVAMNLIGAGRITGYGADESATLVRYSRLPYDHNDMIYAVIVNRWGLLGGLVVLALYLVMTFSFLAVAAVSKDPFARLCIVGFVGLIGTQMLINVGMALGVSPIIGINLPFVSYGGSSLLGSFIMVGLVLNFAWRPPTKLARPSFEFDNADAIFQ